MEQKPSPHSYRAIGLMSGSSLDGLDIACCDFEQRDGQWHFTIPYAQCVHYTPEFVDRLRHAHHADAKSLWQLHADFGHLCGAAVRDFIRHNMIQNVTLVASHGHTIFHFPQQHFTTQIGDGAAIAAECGLPVVCDFRSIDIAKSGQGAPLVPIGDRYLLGDYKFMLNLGGIANVTANQSDTTIAFDICSANQVLNFYAAQKNLPYDADGALAATGTLDKTLFDALNALDYYAATAPKSLDNGYSRDMILPVIEKTDLSVEDKLHTFVEHIAYQIGRHITPFAPSKTDKMLVTGGGTFNGYLMRRIAHHTAVSLVAADDKIANYKEALVFAFMGILRWRNETNILHSVTGAETDSIAGAVYLP